MNVKNKKILLGVGFALLNVGIIVILALADPNLSDLPAIRDAFLSLDSRWLLLALGMITIYVMADAGIIKIGLKNLNRRISYFKCFNITMVGKYYNSITPFATAGQPMQVMFMRRFGLPASLSTSSLVVKYICFQSNYIILGIISIFIIGGKLLDRSAAFFSIAILGIVLNLALLLAILFLAYNSNFVYRISNWTFKLLFKLHIIKDIKKQQETLDKYMTEYREGLKDFKGSFKTIAFMVLLAVISNIALMSIPWCIYKSSNLTGYNYFYITAYSILLFLSVSVVPTPGASGAAEGGFYAFFNTIFAGSTLLFSLLFWRFLSYYLMLGAGGIVVLVNGFAKMVRNTNNGKPLNH